MHSLKIILEKDLWSIKNYIMQIKSNPKRLLLILIYVGWFGYMLSINGRHTQVNSFDHYFTHGMILFMMAITFVINSNAVIKGMSNAFSMGDVNILFTSSIDSRVILLSHFLKKFLITIFSSVFIVFFLFTRGTVQLSLVTIFVSIYGYVSFAYIFEPLNFIILKVQKKIYIYLFQLFLFLLFLIPLIAIALLEKNPMNVLSSELYYQVPLFGWTKAMIESMFVGLNHYSIAGLVSQSFLMILVTALAVYMGTDYYEDVTTSSESMSLKKKKLLSGNNEKRTFAFFGRKKRSIDDHNIHSKALFWKSKQEYAMMDFHHYFGIQTLALFVCSLIIVFVTYMFDDFVWLPYAANGVFVYMILLFTMSKKSKEDYESPYFFMVPGTYAEKLYQCKKLDLIRFFINASVLNLPFFLASEIVMYSIPLMIIGLNFAFWNLTMSNLLFRVFFNDSTDYALSLIIRKLFQMALLIIPSMIVIPVVMITSDSMIAILGSLIGINLFVDLIMLILSGVMASRLEYLG